MLKKVFFRIGAILFGLVILLLIVEISLNTASAIVKNENIQRKAGFDEDAYTILCIGDSFTYGTGVDRTYTYPAQLERMLIDNYPNRSLRVVNLGIPGENSSQMLKALPENIKQHSPDLIIIWAGVDNCWNITDSNYFIFAEIKNFHYFLKRLDAILLKLRTYKLLKITKMNWENRAMRKTALKRPYCDNGAFLKKQDKFLAEAKTLIIENRNNREAILEKLKMAYEIDQNSAIIINLLKGYYPWDEFSEMVAAFFNIVGDEDTLKEIAVTGSVKKALKKAYFTFNIDFKNYNKEVFDRLLEYDLEEMIKFARSNNAEVALLTYFFESIERGGDNVIIRKIAFRYGVPYIDISKVFNKLKKMKSFKYYFFPGGHCNKEGNKAVAKYIFEAVEKEICLD
ncbi:MAG: hypothetical protein ISS45_01930 [Candidatus Omnitrophica bacterium]|nr:hypothetical protein [Candidatus Omnitrophota bacterium]